MEVTKAKAAEMLGVTLQEVVRRIDRGELKARKKTASKFSDWLIEVPEMSSQHQITTKVNDALAKKGRFVKKVEENIPSVEAQPPEDNIPSVEAPPPEDNIPSVEAQPPEENTPEPEAEPTPADLQNIEKDVEVDQKREEKIARLRALRKQYKQEEENDPDKWWF